LFCTVARVQTAPRDLRGIYIYSSDVTQISNSYANELDAALAIPGRTVLSWSLAGARSNRRWVNSNLASSTNGSTRRFHKGRKIDLAIKAGSDMPAWLFQPPPVGVGATPLNFTISPHGGQTACNDSGCNGVTATGPSVTPPRQNSILPRQR